MPLRPGESFLQGSARVKRERAQKKAIASFLPDLSPPPPRIPPVPKAVKQWEKLTPEQKLSVPGGFEAAATVSRSIRDYRADRASQQLADQALTRISKRNEKANIARRDALFKKQKKTPGERAEFAQLAGQYPLYTRPETGGQPSLLAPLSGLSHLWRSAGEPAKKTPTPKGEGYGETLAGVYEALKPLRSYLSSPSTWERSNVQLAGIPAPQIIEDAFEMGAKAAVGGGAGLAGMVRHPLRIPGQIKQIVFDAAQPIGLALAAVPGQAGSGAAREKLFEDFISESLAAMEEQYGPQTSWSSSIKQSYNQGTIAMLTGLGLVAGGTRVLGGIPRVSRASGAYGKGLAPGADYVSPSEAWTGAARPIPPRVLRLRGGAEATGVPVDARYSRSPFIRTGQRVYDAGSRRIPQEKRVVGAFSESRRAGRIQTRRLRRQRRRDLAIAENALREAGLAKESEQLRVMFTRDKPEGIIEEDWLRVLLADAEQMLSDPKLKRTSRDTPKTAKLRRRIRELEAKVDREGSLVAEEIAIQNRLEAAAERGVPTERIEHELSLVQEQLAVVRGHEAPPLPDSPGRVAMEETYKRQFPPEQVEVVMSLADRLARGANPSNPSAWLDRIITRWAATPADVRLDPMKALLQEAKFSPGNDTLHGLGARLVVNVNVGTKKEQRLAKATGEMDEDGNLPVRLLYGNEDELLIPAEDIHLTYHPQYHGSETGYYRPTNRITEWFSPLMRAVEGMKSEKFGRAELEGYLAKAPGLKAEEMEFVGVAKWGRPYGRPTGLDKMLDELFRDKKSITRDELLSALAAQVPKFETQHLSNDDGEPPFYESQYSVTLEGHYDTYWETLLHWPERPEPVGEIYDEDWHYDYEAEPMLDEEGEPILDAYGEPMYHEPEEPDWDEIRRSREAEVDEQTLFQAQHFVDEEYGERDFGRNLVAHLRATTRSLGGRILTFLEELQSDWHREGREGGYINPALEEAYQEAVKVEQAAKEKELAALDLLSDVMEREVKPGMKARSNWGPSVGEVIRVQEGDHTVYRTGRRSTRATFLIRDEDGDERWRGVSDITIEDMNEALGSAWVHHHELELAQQDAYSEMNRIRRERGKVANAPYKDTWHEVLFREAVSQAIQNGHDRIAWTTGDQQAARYNSLVAENISRVTYEPGSRTVKAYDLDGNEQFSEPDVDEDRLRDLLSPEWVKTIKQRMEEPDKRDPALFRIISRDRDERMGRMTDAEEGDTVLVGWPEEGPDTFVPYAQRRIMVRRDPDTDELYAFDYHTAEGSQQLTLTDNLQTLEDMQLIGQQKQQMQIARGVGRSDIIELEGEALSLGGGGFKFNYDSRLGGYAKRLLGNKPRLEMLGSFRLEVDRTYESTPIFYVWDGDKLIAESESAVAAKRQALSGGFDQAMPGYRVERNPDSVEPRAGETAEEFEKRKLARWEEERVKTEEQGGNYIYATQPWHIVKYVVHDRGQPPARAVVAGADSYGEAIETAGRAGSYGRYDDSREIERRFEDAMNGGDGRPVWVADIPEKVQIKLMLEGIPRFQAVYPITGGVPVVKGAMEILSNNRYRQTIFADADISTVVHELGHIALYDMEPEDIAVLDREFAEGRSFRRGEWTAADHERYAEAWEKFFTEDIGKDPALRNVFGKLMTWMRNVYQGAIALGTDLDPEVERVFQKRLGRIARDPTNSLPPDAALARWGTMLATAQTELERAEARAAIARYAGTDEALEADIDDLKKQRDEAMDDDDPDLADEITNEIRAIERELEERDVLNAVRGKRRQKMLASRIREIEKALEKPDSRRYAGARNAADFFQDERETILKDVLGEHYEELFAGRRGQMSQYLADKGLIYPDLAGEGRGFLPFRRKGTEGTASLKQMAAPVTRRIRGRGKTSALNLHTRNQMILWQQGDYRADIGVLYEQYLRAMTFKYQLDLRGLLHSIGEPIDPEAGPKDGWYLIDPDATPLPHHWQKGQTPDQIDAELARLMEGVTADDSKLALTLEKFAEQWMHQDAAKAKLPDEEGGGYGNVRQVHPSTVHQLMLPYTGNQLWNPALKGLTLANTLARVSLIYMGPGYIPSNIVANTIMLFAERGLMTFWDMYEGARMVMKDSRLAGKAVAAMDDPYRGLGRRARAEMGETITTAMTRGDTGQVLGGVRLAERKTAGVVSALADDWVRAAAWSGAARQVGYKGRDAQMRLLDGRDAKTQRDREIVADRASQAMIDFDRLSPWEQRWLRPVVFVWPFIRGATAWPLDYIREHPERAALIVAGTYGFGEAQEEELGPTPDYYSSLVPIDAEQGIVSNVGSVSPVSAFGDLVATGGEQVRSVVSGEPVGTFRNLAGFLAPPSDLALQIIRGQGEFGEAASLQDILTKAAPEYVPFWGLYNDVVDETKPAVQMDQGILDTLVRRTVRFSPQRMNLAILNQQAKERGAAQTVSEKMVEKREAARSAWNQLVPGEHMPRAIEQSIQAYYTTSELRDLLKDEIKKKYRESWQPTRREPKLTPLQEAAIVYDVLAAQHPDVMDDVPDPRDIYDEYGMEGVDRYRAKLETYLFKGKNAADEAIRKAKLAKKAAA